MVLKPRVIENINWYRKTPRTLNRKLRQVIVDALPFDVDHKQADVILRNIFYTIAEGVMRDGFVTIEGLGRFYKYRTRAKRIKCGYPKKWKYIPPRDKIKFLMCRSLNRALREQEDGNSEPSQSA